FLFAHAATPAFDTLSLRDALPICLGEVGGLDEGRDPALDRDVAAQEVRRALEDPRRIAVEAADWEFGGENRDVELLLELDVIVEDRKSTRLNSSHEWISYAVFCLK